MGRPVLLIAAAAVSAGIALPAFAHPGVEVAVDHTTRLHVARPAGSVIVGNPAVADVTVVDPHTVFVSGRGYGVSEVVVLDPLGRTVWDGNVVVTQNTADQVTVYHGTVPVEMACASVCTPSMRNAKQGGSTGGSPAGGSAGGAPSAPAPTQVSAVQPSPGVP
jgi:Pilus formation protein N terminal region